MQDLVMRINGNFVSPSLQKCCLTIRTIFFSYLAPLAAHLQAEGVEFMQFTFRWMNCLMREISIANTIQMWDTYLVRPYSS
jgi:TBC1 domain family member 2